MPEICPLSIKNYLETLLRLKDFKETERLVTRQIKSEPDNPIFRIDFGRLYQEQGRADKAQEEYEQVIQDFKKKSPQTVTMAAEHFFYLGAPELALNMLLSARKASGEKSQFAIELAELYEQQGNQDAMIEEYLLFARHNQAKLEFVKSALQDRIREQADFDQLEKIMLTELQKNPNETTYNELLLWLYLQQKRFYRAFVQAKALDKRYRLEGNELLSIGNIALRNQDYESAKTIFEYIIEAYPNGANYPVARSNYIKAKEEIVKKTFPIQESEIYSLIADYQQLINDVGKNYKTFDAIRSVALLHGFYLDQKDTAVAILNEAVAISGGRTDFIAQCKLDLGDIHLLKNEPWEATLLYSQVEKLKKEHPLGYEAKLKNAKLSFYKGDFVLAQEHLDILKEATSREIANDAMDLSLLIQDNLAFDTTGAALQNYADIELMIFQNKNEQALQKLDKMLTQYPSHSILDEVLWLTANMLLKIGKPSEAAPILDKIVKEYGEGILGDDAYFLLAKTYEETLGEKEKAMEIYKDILVKYPDSIYRNEARLRYRVLRGDFVDIN
ncbi:MAG: tetratricopeptide repeat protein [Bacteroidia bacterium]|nr:tetratricopeptide repeat protein [Bacteroidia bacterium]